MNRLKNILKKTRSFFVISVICGFLVPFAYQATKDAVERNRQEKISSAVSAIFPDSASYTEFAILGNTVKKIDSSTPKDAERVYASYDSGKKLSGIAFQASARGYADDVVILYGYSYEKQCITGYKVLKSKETAGFGDQISSGKTRKSLNFQSSFKCLDVHLNSEKNGLSNQIKLTPPGKKVHGWEFDAIAGATITSRAVEKMLIQSTEELIPVIAANIDVLKDGGK